MYIIRKMQHEYQTIEELESAIVQWVHFTSSQKVDLAPIASFQKFLFFWRPKPFT